MAAKQKTWIDLLGTSTQGTEVSGADIVRRMRGNQYRILWSFDSMRQAEQAHSAWIREVEGRAE